MQYQNQKNRKPNRLKGYDYSQDGWYFVTICTQNRDECFGRITKGEMTLNEFGEAVKTCWLQIPDHFPNVVLEEFVIMPNHVHGILIIDNGYSRNNNNDNDGNKDVCSLPYDNNIKWQTKLSRSLSSIIRGFKIGVTKYFRKKDHDDFQWQKSFYDHIISNEKALLNIREYIVNNPLQWETDRNNTENLWM